MLVIWSPLQLTAKQGIITEQFTARADLFEPPHDKPNKMTVRPAKTQNSLGIRPVWSECAQWVAKDQAFFIKKKTRHGYIYSMQ